jgi:alkylation response protein AidB-like acyl-CoA dehydrogenase
MKIPYHGPTDWPSVLDLIRDRATERDRSGDWPTLELDALAAAGAMRWAVPAAEGGDDLPALDLHLRYEELAAASLAVALILTQRDSAVALVDGSHGAAKRSTMLHRFAAATHFTTVGIAQLTTSRQGGPPALLAERAPGGWRLNGVIPWCTGAALAQFLVIGAALADGQQILLLMEPHLRDVTIQRPMDLVALNSTFTSSIQLKNVLVEDRWLLRGPEDKVLAHRPRHLNLGQAFLATGLCRAALDLIAAHRSDAARDAHARFATQLDALRKRILELSAPGHDRAATAAVPEIRGHCNDLALRLTHAAVALYKGTALLRDHPAQRLAREAMFLLVWSCPNPVIDCTVDVLSRE